MPYRSSLPLLRGTVDRVSASLLVSRRAVYQCRKRLSAAGWPRCRTARRHQGLNISRARLGVCWAQTARSDQPHCDSWGRQYGRCPLTTQLSGALP